MDNQQELQAHKDISVLNYFVLWLSANGMTWFPGFYKLMIVDGSGGVYSVFTWGLVILAFVLVTLFVVFVYARRGRDSQNQRNVFNAGFLMPAISGAVFYAIAALFSILVLANGEPIKTSWINLVAAYALFFVIGFINARIAKRA